MAHEEARYEYRAFAPGFGLVESRLRAAGGAPQIRESAETYFVSRFDDTHNVKIREGQLDIKVLVELSHALEQWAPLPRLPFPIAAEALAEIVAPALGPGVRLPAGAGESAERLIRTVAEWVEGVVVVDLFKRRFGFMVAECIAELAEIEVNGALIQTACVESVDVEQARRVITQVGLDAYPNTSYPAALRRITGLARTPSW